MNIRKAIDILSDHQMWRRGYVKDMPHSTENLGIAIDEILRFVNNRITGVNNIKVLIEKEIIRIFGYSFEDLKTKSRKEEYRMPRHISMYLLRKHTTLPLTKIGAIFGNKHDTVIHAIKSIQNYIDTNDSVRKVINEIESKINEV